MKAEQQRWGRGAAAAGGLRPGWVFSRAVRSCRESLGSRPVRVAFLRMGVLDQNERGNTFSLFPNSPGKRVKERKAKQR